MKEKFDNEKAKNFESKYNAEKLKREELENKYEEEK